MTTKGLYFDGTKKQYAHFNGQDMGLPVGGTDRTLEFWMRAPVGSLDTGILASQPIIEIRECLDTNRRSVSVFSVFLTTRPGATYLSTGNQYHVDLRTFDPLVALPDDQWHFVALAYSRTSSQLGVFLDGKNQKWTSFSRQMYIPAECTCYIGGDPFPLSDAFYIDGNPMKDLSYFTGSISGIRIWNVIRTATEIHSDMINPNTTSAGAQVASILLDEGKGTTFAVKGASGKISTGTLGGAPNNITNSPSWNKPLDANPSSISDGIWFVIQNKTTVGTDFTIPAERLALTVDGNGQIVMDQVPLRGNYDIPLQSNYDRFLWRAMPIGNSYLLVNKRSQDIISWIPGNMGRLLTTKQSAGTIRGWSLTLANQDNWGTNAYFIEDLSAAPRQRITYNSQTRDVFLDGNAPDSELKKQVWLLQPMEVAMGYDIPAPSDVSSLHPFTKMLTSEYGVTFYATITTSEWAILNTHLIIRNVINAIQTSYVPATAFTGWKMLILSGYDNNPDVVAGYPIIKEVFDSGWVQSYWGGTAGGSTKMVFLTESMMCQKGIPYRKPEPPEEKPDFAYREFEQVVHEFGHAIEETILGDKARTQPEANSSAEWFPWQVQYWLNSAQSAGAGLNRSQLSQAAMQYLSGIFKTSNDWLPPRWLRDHFMETFELRCGDILTPGQALRSASLDLVLRLQEDGNLTVKDADGFKWGSLQSLGVGLSETQSVKMDGNGHLRLLDGSGKELWASPNRAPGIRLIVTDPESPGHYLKIFDENGGSLWESTN